jgi:hypothetical protein
MIGKCKVFIMVAIIAGISPYLHDGPGAFELFPRPEGQYTVKRGDTLYGISGLYYANPALWSFLWNQNPSIKMKPGTRNPQYEPLVPGTVLDIYHQRFPFTVMNRNYTPPTGISDDIRFLTKTIPYQGIPYDKKYFKYKLSPRPARVWGYIVSSPEVNKVHFLERDLVYVRFRPSKRQCILVGDRFGIYRDKGPLFHPINPERPVGYLAEVVGEIEITSTGHNLITGIILESYVEIERGDKICLFTPRRKEIVPTKTHRMLTGTILRSATRNTFYKESINLENDIVFINRGKCDGMEQGILVNIYRPSHPIKDPYFQRRVSIPDRYLGEGMVLKAFKNNSTLLITRSREEILPGDIIKSVSD